MQDEQQKFSTKNAFVLSLSKDGWIAKKNKWNVLGSHSSLCRR